MVNATLADRTVLVTGAGRGIGEAIAREAARQGARVAVLDVDGVAAGAVADALTAVGGVAQAVVADITDEEAVRSAVDDITSRLGPVDVLVNNAGRNSYGDPATMTSTEWDEVFAVDLKGAWLVIRAVLPAMTERRRGSVVNIASLHARLTAQGMFPYAAAKSGLVGLTRSLALDVARHGIRVNAVSPGYIATQLVDEHFARHADPALLEQTLAVQPLGRFGAPHEVAAVVCFLASDASTYVTGADWAVDGGLGARFA